ncbi:MAG TPA: endonuclease/exonuclease/phosphatase family protein [Bacteroidales bacterium]|nr:endonuclease/exonuclease/phosphatase family protein [Bacteroidales bacterium]
MKLICAFILTLTVSIPALFSQDKIDSNKVVKVLTFNIFHGATTRGDYDLDVIAKVIREADPDFVALQEVDFKTNRSKKYDLVTELGWRVKMAAIFARAMYYDGGEYGEGVLSKYSFIKTRNIALPYTVGNEPRAAIEVVTVLRSGDTIAFIGTHLDHLKNENDRVAQVNKINEVFSSNPYPAILAGDLNAQPGSTPINILEAVWSSSYDKSDPEPTFPSDDPRVKIDYVMHFPKNAWRVLETKVIPDSLASDHCACLVTLELRND